MSVAATTKPTLFTYSAHSIGGSRGRRMDVHALLCEQHVLLPMLAMLSFSMVHLFLFLEDTLLFFFKREETQAMH